MGECRSATAASDASAVAHPAAMLGALALVLLVVAAEKSAAPAPAGPAHVRARLTRLIRQALCKPDGARFGEQSCAAARRPDAPEPLVPQVSSQVALTAELTKAVRRLTPELLREAPELPMPERWAALQEAVHWERLAQSVQCMSDGV